MPLTVEQLRRGIAYWHEERPGWDQDFHNAFYRDVVPTVRPANAFTQDWWNNKMWPILQEWSATRRGGGRRLMTQRAVDRLELLSETWVTAVSPLLDSDIEQVDWSQIAAFPILVGQIKPVKSPVFTSKFCHFLVPRIFPVVDNKAIGNPFQTYEEYFKTAKSEWAATPAETQTQLVGLLSSEIGESLFGGFPMKCKLVELCLIGRYQSRPRAARHNREQSTSGRCPLVTANRSLAS